MRNDRTAVDLRAVFDDLVRFETVLWAAIDSRLRRDCDVPLGSINVMMVIDSTPQCRVFDVATALVITVGGASQAVDRIEAIGWCRRRPNPNDRRSSILELSAAGEQTLARAMLVFDEELERYLRTPLSATALGQLAAGLSKIRNAATDNGGNPQPTAS